MRQSTKNLDAERLSIAISAFQKAMNGTSQDAPLAERARVVLAVLPEPVVRELGDAARKFAELADERLEG